MALHCFDESSSDEPTVGVYGCCDCEDGAKRSGTVDMEYRESGFSSGAISALEHFKGRSYSFKVGGMKVMFWPREMGSANETKQPDNL